MYKFKKCSKCGKYNGTTHRMCAACRKAARTFQKKYKKKK